MSVKQILLWFLGQASIGLLKLYEVENVKLNIYKMCKQCSHFFALLCSSEIKNSKFQYGLCLKHILSGENILFQSF